MKLSLLQMLVIALLSTVVYSADINGQDILDKKVSFNARNKDLKDILRLIEKEASVRFNYSDNVIKSGKKKSLVVIDVKLRNVLDSLLESNIVYEVVGKEIVLRSIMQENPQTSLLSEPSNDFDRIVTGKVTDTSGDGIPGVNILEKGTTNGTVSDTNGDYSLGRVQDGATLLFSFIGYESKEVVTGDQTIINVSLATDLKTLGEVVVVGYGIQEQKEVTSSIVSVKSEEFNRGNVSNPAQLLQGKVAGLTISRAGGDPNQPFTIRLRGLATFGANSEPLIIVDGLIGASFNSLDPNDIESMEVLKDASAGAIYGTRASSGVIIITTKSGGKNSKPVVEYNGFVSAEQISNTIHVGTPEEFLQYGGFDQGYRTDWLDQVAGTGISDTHNVAVSNTAGSLSYRASFNYRSVDAVLKGTGFDQLNGRINITQKLLKDKLKLTAIVSNTKRESNIGFAQALRYSLNFNPTAPVYIDNDPSKGYFETNVQDVFNPVAINKLNTNISRTSTLLTNFSADYEVVKGLNVTANYSYQSVDVSGGQYLHSQSIFGIPSGKARNGIATRSSNLSTNELFEMTATYKGIIDKLKYSVLGGYSWNELEFENFSVQNTGFLTDAVTFNNLGLGSGIRDNLAVMNSSKEAARLISFFGRLNFNLKDTYFLSASLRHEGSSRFGANNRWGNFWAVSGGVNITELVKIPAFSNLKFRAGYGVTGNLPSQNYAYLERLGSTGGLGYVNGVYVPAIGPTSNPNPDLKWEQKAEFNVGIDFGLLEDRLTGSADYFIRNTTNLLNTISVPSPPNLYGTSLVNLGELKTTGFELALNYKAINKSDFTWSIGTNYSSYVTTLVKFNNLENSIQYRGNLGAPGLNGTNVIKIAEGERIGQIYAPKFVRYNENGIAVMLDKDGKETLVRDNKDFVKVGNGLPKFSIGLTNNFVYKNFDLNIFLRGVFGHSLVNINRAYFEHPANTGKGNIVITDKFSPLDKETEAWHSGYVEKASFVRLDNATLGYNFPFKAESVVRKLRIYFTGQNLFTITKYTGADPEPRYYDYGPITEGNSNNTYSGDILTPGIDNRVTYFPTKIYTFGVNVTF